MSEDRRSRKMIAVINCVINHSARAEGAARYPGVNHDVLDILRRHGVGVIQMPCPEMVCLGLARARAEGLSIRDVLDTPAGRSRCAELSRGVVDTIQEFQRLRLRRAGDPRRGRGEPRMRGPSPPGHRRRADARRPLGCLHGGASRRAEQARHPHPRQGCTRFGAGNAGGGSRLAGQHVGPVVRKGRNTRLAPGQLSGARSHTHAFQWKCGVRCGGYERRNGRTPYERGRRISPPALSVAPLRAAAG